MLAFFIDLLEIPSILSKCFQDEKIDPVYAMQCLNKADGRFELFVQKKFEKLPHVKDLKKKLYGPFLLWMGFNCLKATATLRRQFTFYHSVPRNSWYSFYRPRKGKRLSRPWSHPVVLITVPLDWESSTLTTRPLLHKKKDGEFIYQDVKLPGFEIAKN